jgi:hypothetical protein
MKSLTSQHKTANAFAGTFAFLPTLEPTQKKQKSLQVNAQRQLKLNRAEDRPKEAQQVTAVWRNGGFSASYVSFVGKQTLVLRINICGENPPLRQAANRQVVKKLPF